MEASFTRQRWNQPLGKAKPDPLKPIANSLPLGAHRAFYRVLVGSLGSVSRPTNCANRSTISDEMTNAECPEAIS